MYLKHIYIADPVRLLPVLIDHELTGGEDASAGEKVKQD